MEEKMSEQKKRKITRRDFMKGSLVIGGALAVGGVGKRLYSNHVNRDFDPARSKALLASIKPSEKLDKLPNIIIIFVDDLGYGDLSCYGSKSINTPNLDRMAAEGVRMTNFYAVAPICTPSRASLLTGRYPKRTHMTFPLFPSNHPMRYFLDVIGYYPYGIVNIPEDEVLLPEILLRRGYKTGLIGKWHLGDKPNHIPNDRGFEFFYGALYSNDDLPYAIYRNYEIEIESPADQNVLTQNLTREAKTFIQNNKNSPFFLYFAHPMPHMPLHASDEFRGRSAGGLYGDAVEEIDWSVGEILNSVQELGLDERTLVIFTSDNGPWYQGNPGYTRGRKNLFFEGGLLVPFIAKWPEVIPAGTVTDEISTNFDLFTTYLKLAGVPLPNDRIIDGKDIMPLLMGKAPSPHDTFYYYDVDTLIGIRHNNWKYLRPHMSDNGAFRTRFIKQGPFLFNLELDPNESYSMIESEPEIAQMLSKMLDKWEAEMEMNVRGWLS